MWEYSAIERLQEKKRDREGVNNLLSFIEKEDIDYVVVESLDRLSRDPVQSHMLFDVFRHYQIEILSPNEGKISKLLIGLKSTMDSIFIDETASKVMRSHRKIAKEGRIPGGLAYGYRVKTDAVDGRGKRLNGEREIIKEQAEVVQRIFEMYADGAGSKAIAQRLNIEGIPSPTYGYWGASTILGSRVKSSGILFNETYRGSLVWNRSKKAVHPISQKRLQTIKEPKDWITTPILHLRIVSDELWNKVQARLLFNAPSIKSLATTNTNRTSHSSKHLSGMVYCGVCGAKSQRANHTRYVCGSYRAHRICNNARGTKEEALVEAIFDQLKNWVQSVDHIDIAFTKVFKNEKKRTKLINTKLRELDKRIKGYEFVIRDGVNIPEISKNLKKLQQQKSEALSHINVFIPEIPSSIAIKKTLIERGLKGLKEDFWSNSFAQSWRATMSLLIKEVITTPIPDKKKGMTVKVVIAPMEGWAEFYRRISAKKAGG